MNQAVDFAEGFAALAASGEHEITHALGGVHVRLVRVAAGGEGRWDRHDDGPETVVVWSGRFQVEFDDATLVLGPGECCVVANEAAHRGTSSTGAEVILFRGAGLAL